MFAVINDQKKVVISSMTNSFDVLKTDIETVEKIFKDFERVIVDKDIFDYLIDSSFVLNKSYVVDVTNESLHAVVRSGNTEFGQINDLFSNIDKETFKSYDKLIYAKTQNTNFTINQSPWSVQPSFPVYPTYPDTYSNPDQPDIYYLCSTEHRNPMSTKCGD